MHDDNATLYEVTFVSYDYYSHDEHISRPIVLDEEEMRKHFTDEDKDKVHAVRMLTPSEVTAYRMGQDEGRGYAYKETTKLRDSIREEIVKFLYNLGRAVEEKTSKQTLSDIRFLASIGVYDDSLTFRSLEKTFDQFIDGMSAIHGNEFEQAFLGGDAMEIAKALDKAKAKAKGNTLEEDEALTQLREKLADKTEQE